MRVALVTDKFDFGGGLEHIFQICNGLPSVHFGVFGDPGPATEKFHSLSNVEVFDNGYRLNYIKKFSPDILHIHHLKPLLSLWLQRSPYPKIFTIHGVHIRKFMFQGGAQARIRMAIRIALEKQLFGNVNSLVTVSLSDQELILKTHGVSNSELIYNGVDIQGIKKNRLPKAEMRRALGLPIEGKLLLTVARFDYPKGYDILLDAIGLLVQNGIPAKTTFIFVGGGELLINMKAKAEKLGIAQHVIFTGPRPDAIRFMHAADVFILPSRYEGLPITLLEALACSLPIIASKTSGISELATHFPEAIRLFENGNSSSLMHHLIAPLHEAKEWEMDKFETKTMARTLESLYSRLPQTFRVEGVPNWKRPR